MQVLAVIVPFRDQTKIDDQLPNCTHYFLFCFVLTKIAESFRLSYEYAIRHEYAI